MRRKILIFIVLVVILAGAFYLWQKYKGALPALAPSENITSRLPTSGQIPEAINQTDIPLILPRGFVISILAKNLPGARDLVEDSFGNLWVSQTSEGQITQVEIKDGVAVGQNAILRNLNRPHGLALDGNMLYFAEEAKISRVPLYSDGNVEKLADLPKGGRHFTRSLIFGDDGKLYVSIGSTCDVCEEKDDRAASIYSLNKDGSDFKKVAEGLRNAVFMAKDPRGGKIWVTEMGRDNLGDNLPPDEINVIETGVGPETSSGRAAEPLDFGWPNCFGKNIHDTRFDKNKYFRDPCADKTPSFIDLPAHSAPLGLAFVPLAGWPAEYQNNLIVAFHGSWNRSRPTGYKLVHIKFNNKGEYEGMEDFISGWLGENGRTTLGRPVQILFSSKNVMYVTDDKAGVIYKINNQSVNATAENQPVKNLNIIPNQKIESPLIVTGEALGGWFFEANFPIKVFDQNNRELATGIAQANEDWMTEGFVRFSSAINFSKPETPNGRLVLKKDNPSGLPENEEEFSIPIKFE